MSVRQVVIGLAVLYIVVILTVIAILMARTGEERVYVDPPTPIGWPQPPPLQPSINITVEQPKACDQGGMLQRMCEVGGTK